MLARTRAASAGAFLPPSYNGPIVSAPLPDLFLYGRPGCHLCEDTHAVLDLLLADRAARGLAAPQVIERDIDTNEDWHRRYALTIPVVVLGDQELELATSAPRLRQLLDTALGEVPQR